MRRRLSSLHKSLVGIIILFSSFKPIGSSSWSTISLARNSLLTMTSTSPRRSRRLTTTTSTASTVLFESNSKRKPKAVPLSADSDSNNNNSSSSSRGSTKQLSLLQNWMDHDDASFHHFSPEMAETIRSALLEWYKGNRRKLPWRGDSPPFDGSTAGINNGKKKAAVQKKQALDIKNKNQANITNFFATTSTSSTTTTTATPSKKQEKDETQQVLEPQEAAIPMTGYGVWVSEIMLQQTRVEAVIPYWLKCKLSRLQYSNCR
jgi:hypothetical protein